MIAETIRQRLPPSTISFPAVGINVAASHFRHGVLPGRFNQYWFSAVPFSNWCWSSRNATRCLTLITA
ncbi:hypothetical protein KCP73_00455 [Salmonella enterica subsp. enterica]|nr:hypothetical protein KCP73_00455 [Salmonella enterica subsp. enterica]